MSWKEQTEFYSDNSRKEEINEYNVQKNLHQCFMSTELKPKQPEVKEHLQEDFM